MVVQQGGRGQNNPRHLPMLHLKPGVDLGEPHQAITHSTHKLQLLICFRSTQPTRA